MHAPPSIYKLQLLLCDKLLHCRLHLRSLLTHIYIQTIRARNNKWEDEEEKYRQMQCTHTHIRCIRAKNHKRKDEVVKSIDRCNKLMHMASTKKCFSWVVSVIYLELYHFRKLTLNKGFEDKRTCSLHHFWKKACSTYMNFLSGCCRSAIMTLSRMYCTPACWMLLLAP